MTNITSPKNNFNIYFYVQGLSPYKKDIMMDFMNL
jgi:hypothetical protein